MNYRCKFCQQTGLELLFEANQTEKEKTPAAFACTNCGFGRHGRIVKCRQCNLVYVDEQVSQNKISTYYEVAEDPLYFAEQGARRRTFGNYLYNLEKVYPKKGKLLDVGTNTGLFVRLAMDNGWQATGLEPNHWAVDYARKNYGIKLINKPYERNSFPAESFEVITMWDVVEHFTDPVSELAKVFQQLKPGGVFAFSTVDPESFLAKVAGTKWSWYMHMHKTFFSRKAAEHYLKEAGFSKIIFKSHWRYLSLGYLASRLVAINQKLAAVLAKTVKILRLEKMIVPYYANDLYDGYAFK